MTKLPISDVSVIELETYEGTDTDSNGYFKIPIYDTLSTFHLNFFHKIYDSYETSFRFDQKLPLIIYLHTEQIIANEVVIVHKRQKYRNKNNPAVELIRTAISKKDENDILRNGTFQSQYYEKINVGVSRVPRFLTHNFILKPFRFVFDNYDTITYPGHKNLTIYMEENWVDYAFHSPKNLSKKRIHHQKKVSLDPNYINEEGTVAQLKHLYQDVNIYDNNLILVTNNFLSPIGVSAPQFYKYFIEDTVIDNYGHRIVGLRVEPRNKQDLLVFGDIYIDIDNNHSVVKYKFETTKSTNINFVDKVIIEADYQFDEFSKKYYLKKYDNRVIFSLYFKSNRKMIGSRSLLLSDYNSNPSIPDSIFTQPEVEYDKEHVNNKSDSLFYQNNRILPFTVYEKKTYENLDSLQNMKYFKNLIDWSSAIFTGYKKVGKFDIGPLYGFYSYNNVDKHRFRLGIRTNPNMFDRYFASSYIAYSTGYDDIRYHFLGRYSLKNKRIYEYPMNYIQLFVQRDVKLQGRIGEISVQDNIFESIQRGDNDRFLLSNNFKLDYVREFKNNFVVTTYMMYNHLSPRGALYYTTLNEFGESDTIQTLVNAAVGLGIRWSPGEKIYNDRTQRNRLHGKSPIFTLGLESGFPDILDSDVRYTRINASITKRNFLGPFGILDFYLSGNYLFGTVPYPLLNVPRANQTYTFSGNSYNLMNNGEFISDKQVEFNMNYRMMGFIMNKLPLIKHLRLREVAGIKMVYGHLSSNNHPYYNPNVFQFPVDANHQSYIYTFEKNIPYIEWNVGVENIFKFLRVDYVRRVNYLNHRNVSKHGVNLSVVIDF